MMFQRRTKTKDWEFKRFNISNFKSTERKILREIEKTPNQISSNHRESKCKAEILRENRIQTHRKETKPVIDKLFGISHKRKDQIFLLLFRSIQLRNYYSPKYDRIKKIKFDIDEANR